jgi:hypothetical protein
LPDLDERCGIYTNMSELGGRRGIKRWECRYKPFTHVNRETILNIPGKKYRNMYYHCDDEAHESDQMLNDKKFVMPISDRRYGADVDP